MTISKTFLLMACLGLTLGLTSACGDDTPYTAASSIKLLESTTCFSAAAQQGHISLAPTQQLTAHTAAPWCHVAVESNAYVSISVDRNTELTGRSTEIVLQGEGATARVPVTQQGAVWYVMGDSTYVVGDEPTVITIPLHSDYDYTVSLPSWASGQAVEGAYEVSLTANATHSVRRTLCVFESEKGSRSISICQVGANDLAGTYHLTYGIPVTTTENRDTTITIQLEQSATDSLAFLASGMSVIPGVRIPFTYDPLTLSLQISAGQLLGQVGGQQRYVFTALASEAGAHTGTSLSYGAPVTIDHHTLMPSFVFADAEGFTFYDSNGDEQMAHIFGILTIGTVQNLASISADNFLGYADRMMYPRLTKISNQ